MGNGANFPYIITGGYPGQNDNLADLFVDRPPAGARTTTNYKGIDGGDIGDYSMASMHPSDTRDSSGVPYFVNGTNITNLFRSIEFQPVSIDITDYSYNNSYANSLTSNTLYASVSGTNVNSNHYSVEWKYEYTFGGYFFGSATPDNSNSLSTTFTGTLEPSSYSVYVSCTITDLLTGETAIDYTIIDWYMA
jgi:hypothetical protein